MSVFSSTIPRSERAPRDPARVANPGATSLWSRLLMDMGGLLGLRIVFGGLSFVVTILLARTLGPTGLGAYNYVFTWIVLLTTLAVLGMDQLLVREIAAYQVQSEWGLLRGILRMANVAGLSVSLGIGLLVALVSWSLQTSWAPETVLTFWIALPLLPVLTLTRVRQGALRGLHQPVLASMPDRLIQPGLLMVFVSVAYLFSSLTAPIAMGLNVLATGVSFFIGTRLLYHHLPRTVKKAAAVYQKSAWARSAFPIALIAGMGILSSQSGTLILGAVKGADEVGLYSVASQAAELLNVFLVMQSTAFASTAAALFASGDLELLQKLITKIARWTFLPILPLGLIFIGFGHWFLLYGYGVQFTPAWRALAILSSGQLVNVCAGLNSVLLVMTGYQGRAATVSGIAAVVTILLNFLLVPVWGLEGAALGSAVGVILRNILSSIALYEATGIHSTALGVLRLRPLS